VISNHDSELVVGRINFNSLKFFVPDIGQLKG
jgi:hypothetical protein